jgi:pimeloyl-ACP methyl ester carboxylesterase
MDAAIDDLEPEPWPLGVLTSVANALDRLVLRGMALAFHAALLCPAEERARLRASMAPYITAALERDPRAFFAFLDQRDSEPKPQPVAHRSIPGGTIVTRRMPSDYVPFARTEGCAASCEENETVWFEHWMHANRQPRATVVLLHGFTMGSPEFDGRVMMAQRWFERGLDVALVTLPYHGRRASARCRYSGELFASWHVGQLNEAVRQAVHDVDRVIDWLRGCGRGPVGLLGVSLGGYVTALLAALRADLAFAIPAVPAVCLADLPLRLFECRGGGPHDAPFTFAELARAYRVHSPLTYPLRLPRERVLVIGGRGDAVTPVSQARSLWRHWGEPTATWFSGGHVVAFRRFQVVDAIHAHFASLGLLDPERVDSSALRAA